MNIHRAFKTAREWTQGVAINTFRRLGRIVNARHQKALLHEIKQEQGWLSEHLGKSENGYHYSAKDEIDLNNLEEVVESANIGEQLRPAQNDTEGMERQWEREEEKEEECNCSACEKARQKSEKTTNLEKLKASFLNGSFRATPINPCSEELKNPCSEDLKISFVDYLKKEGLI